MTILTLLDNKIETFRQNKGDYSLKIIMSKETKDKIFAELKKSSPIIENCWIDKNDNYRGLPIEIKEGIFIELK
jgi:hypothetical protein